MIHTHTYIYIYISKRHVLGILTFINPLYIHTTCLHIHTYNIHTYIHTYIHTLAVIIRVFNTSSGVVKAAAKDPATIPTTRFSNGLGKICVYECTNARMYVCMYVCMYVLYARMCMYIRVDYDIQNQIIRV